LFTANVLYHMPLTQAYALGVAPPPATTLFGVGLNLLGVTSGPILQVAGDTVTQIIAYIKATDGNTQAASSQTPLQQQFVGAMASFAPQAAEISGAGIGVHAANGMASLVAGGGGFRYNTHVVVA